MVVFSITTQSCYHVFSRNERVEEGYSFHPVTWSREQPVLFKHTELFSNPNTDKIGTCIRLMLTCNLSVLPQKNTTATMVVPHAAPRPLSHTCNLSNYLPFLLPSKSLQSKTVLILRKVNCPCSEAWSTSLEWSFNSHSKLILCHYKVFVTSLEHLLSFKTYLLALFVWVYISLSHSTIEEGQYSKTLVQRPQWPNMFCRKFHFWLAVVWFCAVTTCL